MPPHGSNNIGPDVASLILDRIRETRDDVREVVRSVADVKITQARMEERMEGDVSEIKAAQVRMESRMEEFETREWTPAPRVKKEPRPRPLLAKGAITISSLGLGTGLGWLLQKLSGH